jgi:hypothetical protein
MNGLVHGCRSERLIIVPIDIEHRVRVRRPLLLHLPTAQFPETDRVVEGTSEEHGADAVPFEGEDGALVHRQDEMQVAGGSAVYREYVSERRRGRGLTSRSWRFHLHYQ